MPASMSHQVFGLFAWLLLAFVAAATGGLASVNAADFYHQLMRPSWAPPGWLFGPVWTALYTLMGIAAWLVWRERGFAGARNALALFVVQLAVNALWSWLFFAWHLGGLACGDVLLLEALILATLVQFWRINKVAGVLLSPYLAWVSFAAVLNFATWRLNPELLG